MSDMPNTSQSQQWFERSSKVIPGGVNSPVRAFGSVGGQARVIERGAGSRLWDVDGNEYVDLVSSYGPMIHGNAHPAIVEAVQKAATDGLSFGAPTEGETLLAEHIVKRTAVEQVRLVNSGTEATMSAVRLARGFTGRFDGREVRGVLPRARRFPPGLGGQWRGDLRFAGFTRCDPERHDRGSVQRSRCGS